MRFGIAGYTVSIVSITVLLINQWQHCTYFCLGSTLWMVIIFGMFRRQNYCFVSNDDSSRLSKFPTFGALVIIFSTFSKFVDVSWLSYALIDVHCLQQLYFRNTDRTYFFHFLLDTDMVHLVLALCYMGWKVY